MNSPDKRKYSLEKGLKWQFRKNAFNPITVYGIGGLSIFIIFMSSNSILAILAFIGLSYSIIKYGWYKYNFNMYEKYLAELKQKTDELNQDQERLQLQREKEMKEKYGDEKGKKISARELFLDMTEEMLIDSIGLPEDVKESISKKMIRNKYYYKPKQTHLKTTAYKLEVTLENKMVVGWRDLD